MWCSTLPTFTFTLRRAGEHCPPPRLVSRLITILPFRWPTDVADFLPYVTPEFNYRVTSPNVAFSSIASLNESTYLTSTQAATDSLPYLQSVSGKPNATAYSAAPITVVAVPKANGTLDAFYHTFWAFNKGDKWVLSVSVVVYSEI